MDWPRGGATFQKARKKGPADPPLPPWLELVCVAGCVLLVVSCLLLVVSCLLLVVSCLPAGGGLVAKPGTVLRARARNSGAPVSC